jgi:hypothetical protein
MLPLSRRLGYAGIGTRCSNRVRCGAPLRLQQRDDRSKLLSIVARILHAQMIVARVPKLRIAPVVLKETFYVAPERIQAGGITAGRVRPGPRGMIKSVTMERRPTAPIFPPRATTLLRRAWALGQLVGLWVAQ